MHNNSYQIQILSVALQYIQAVGTEGEVALTTAIKNAFPNAIHFHCVKHFCDNYEAKL